MMDQAHVFISGQVQGVSFRYFIKTNARQLGLTGWVRNAEDGGVEAVFCGERKKIEEMIALCRQGPFLADVKHLGFEWEETGVFEGFKIMD
ncbi:MAG TPA: acylphosphatase [Candidatus Acidoferrales bacterium]|nr:acylphosphatase [Candidatus Acidoferrales bacterium]